MNIELYGLTIFRVFKHRSGYGDKENRCVFSLVLESDNWVSEDSDKDYYGDDELCEYLRSECNCFDAFDDNEAEISYDSI